MTDEIKRDTVDYRDPTPFDNTKLNSLSDISKALRHKTYGEDTREAIAQQGEALAKLMQETGGNQSAEVVAARGNYETLGIREDAQDGAIVKAQSTAVKAQSTADSKFDTNQAESYLKSITALPETFANLAAIKAKYPSGKNGLMVAADNGHKYVWSNGTWTDAGVYQSVGIAEGTIDTNNLTKVAQENLSSKMLDVEVSPLSQGLKKYINFDLEIGNINFKDAAEFRDNASARTSYVKFSEADIIIINKNRTYRYQMYEWDNDGNYLGTTFNYKDYEVFRMTADVNKKYRFAISKTDGTSIDLSDVNINFALANQSDALGYSIDNLYKIKYGHIDIGGNFRPKFNGPYGPYLLDVTLPGNNIYYYDNYNILINKTLDSEKNKVYTLTNHSSLVWNLLTNAISIIPYGQESDGYNVILATNSYGFVNDGYLSKFVYIPDDNAGMKTYWKDYMSDKIPEIRERELSLGTGDEFIFITDTHWGDNEKQSPSLIENIKQNTGIENVIFGGDIPRAYGTKESITDDVYGFNTAVRSIQREKNYYPVIGNHDFTIRFNRTDTTGFTYDKSQSYSLFGRNLENYTNISDEKMYYYRDNTAQKIRYVFVNTEDSIDETISWGVAAKISQEQADWLINTALNVPDGYQIFVVGHVPIHPDLPAYSSQLDILRKIFEAINNKTSLSFDTGYGTTVNHDFSNTNTKIIAYLAGHCHKDTSKKDNNLLHITTGCDAHYGDDVWARTTQTTSEQLFDVFFIDTENSKINTVRIGAGNDRSFDY